MHARSECTIHFLKSLLLPCPTLGKRDVHLLLRLTWFITHSNPAFLNHAPALFRHPNRCPTTATTTAILRGAVHMATSDGGGENRMASASPNADAGESRAARIPFTTTRAGGDEATARQIPRATCSRSLPGGRDIRAIQSKNRRVHARRARLGATLQLMAVGVGAGGLRH